LGYNSRWSLVYQKIRKDFGFPIDGDKLAAKVLDKIIETKKSPHITLLKRKINNKNVTIFGAGPDLENILKEKKFLNKTLLAADGATTALIQHNILPDIIVTDLDGKIEDQVEANSRGSIVVVHAHGDNIDEIKKYVPRFKGYLIGTTQLDPSNYKNLYNFGGFTDGDRAAYMAAFFKPKKIYLAAFDFEKIGRYSFTKNVENKLKKLKWCKYLLKKLEEEVELIYI